MNDLMAIATVRRLIVEMGLQLQPEGPAGLVGPLSLWIAQPRPELDGLTPQQALSEVDGEERIRRVLAAMLAQRESGA